MNTKKAINRRQFLANTVAGGAVLGVAAALMPAAYLRADAVGDPTCNRDLSGWRKPTGDWLSAKEIALDPTNSSKFAMTAGEGVLVNGAAGRTVNLVTERSMAMSNYISSSAFQNTPIRESI